MKCMTNVGTIIPWRRMGRVDQDGQGLRDKGALTFCREEGQGEGGDTQPCEDANLIRCHRGAA